MSETTLASRSVHGRTHGANTRSHRDDVDKDETIFRIIETIGRKLECFFTRTSRIEIDQVWSRNGIHISTYKTCEFCVCAFKNSPKLIERYTDNILVAYSE